MIDFQIVTKTKNYFIRKIPLWYKGSQVLMGLSGFCGKGNMSIRLLKHKMSGNRVMKGDSKMLLYNQGEVSFFLDLTSIQDS